MIKRADGIAAVGKNHSSQVAEISLQALIEDAASLLACENRKMRIGQSDALRGSHQANGNHSHGVDKLFGNVVVQASDDFVPFMGQSTGCFERVGENLVEFSLHHNTSSPKAASPRAA